MGGRIVSVAARSALWLLAALSAASANAEVLTIRPVDADSRLPGRGGDGGVAR